MLVDIVVIVPVVVIAVSQQELPHSLESDCLLTSCSFFFLFLHVGFQNCALNAHPGMFPGFVVKTQDHSSKVVADHCFICVLVSFIRRGWARPRAWGRYYGTRIGLALFLFPPFYLSCHYVSSAVFNDGSSLQAVSGCIAVGGGDVVAAGGLCLFSSLFYVSLLTGDKKQVSHMPRTVSSVIV